MRHRVLVIDDNPADMELMVYLLGALDCEAVPAGDTREGIEAALAEQPSLVICDVHDARHRAAAIIETFKNHPALPPIPLVALAAAERELLLHIGFDGCIDKPIDAAAFTGCIEEFLLRRPAATLVRPWERRHQGHRPDH